MLLKDQLVVHGNWLFRHRGSLPLIALAGGIGLYLYRVWHGAGFFPGFSGWSYAYDLLCLGVGLCGLAIRVWVVGYTPAGTSGRNTAEGQVAEQLNTTGLYSVVRNPLYLGNFLMWLAVAGLTRSIWFAGVFIAFFWLFYERIILAEEDFLTLRFGPPYRAWADRTPCFWPRLGGYLAPKLPFSWKKALKKEKNGLLNFLLIFSLLDLAGAWMLGLPPRHLWLEITTGLVLTGFVAVKCLQRYSTRLDEEGR